MNTRPVVSVPAAAVVADPMSTRGVIQVITDDQVITGEQARAIAEAVAQTPGAPSGPVRIIKPAVNAPPAEPPRRKQFVSRRTFDGLRPRAPRVPTTAEESLALRMAELKRRRKGAARVANLMREVGFIRLRPSAGENAPDSLTMKPGHIVAVDPLDEPIYEPAAPAPFVVIDVAGDAP